MLRRGFKGALQGAVIAVTCIVLLTVILFGIFFFIPSDSPTHRSDVLHDLFRILLLGISASAIVGALGGFAAKLPRHGMRILPSITIVAGCAIIARIPVAWRPIYKGITEPPSYLPPLIAAVIGCLLVLVYGTIRSKCSGFVDPE